MVAPLADPAISAASKVAQLHLESELIVKDNDRLLKYLNMASDRGVAAAQVELGKFYEAGALVEKDLEHAEQLYAQSSDAGNRTALFRAATLLETEQANPAKRAEFKARLTQLADMPSPPCFAFSKLATLVLEEKGVAGLARPKRRNWLSKRAWRSMTPTAPRNRPSSWPAIATSRACSDRCHCLSC